MQLLQQDPKKRLDSLEALKQESLMADVDWESVEAVNVQPSFVPPVSLVLNGLSIGLTYSTCINQVKQTCEESQLLKQNYTQMDRDKQEILKFLRINSNSIFAFIKKLNFFMEI